MGIMELFRENVDDALLDPNLAPKRFSRHPVSLEKVTQMLWADTQLVR